MAMQEPILTLAMLLDVVRRERELEAAESAASRLAVSIWLVGDVRREVKAPRPAAS
jgi:hypothetical protein